MDLQVPKDDQIGKTIHIVGSGGTVELLLTPPTDVNSHGLVNIPAGKRITIFALKKGIWGNKNNDWCVIAKDF